MGRPVKWRRVNQLPSVLQFVPTNEDGAMDPQSKAAENILLIEEYEAIRLKDLEGLEQEECAEQMQISRPTFQRILITAREKVADSLINGKGIRISGGNFTQNICPVYCLDCGETWQESIEVLTQTKTSYTCPHCKSNRIVCATFKPCVKGRGQKNRFCQRGCWRNGWNSRLNQEESERENDIEDHDSD